MFQVCPAGCAECSESSSGDIVCDTCVASTRVEVAALQCVGECQCVTLDLDFVAPV